MNEFIQKIKKFLISVYGKCFIFVFLFAFLITAILSIMQKNSILYSFLRALISGVLACFIIYGVYIALSKVLGDIFLQIFLDTKESSVNGSENVNEILDNNTERSKEDLEYSEKNNYNNAKEDNINAASSGLNVPLDIEENTENTVDKNSKVSYHNSSDDISSIVFGSGFGGENKTANAYESKASSDKESDKIVKSMPLDNPELLAKAVRTMRAKDKENN